MNKVPAIIDLRAFDEFKSGHLVGACHIEAKSLAQQLYLLPDKDRALILVGSAQDLGVANEFLSARGYQIAQQISSQEIKHWQDVLGWKMGTQSKRYWQPSPLLKHFVAQYSVPEGEALDYACGAGRDAVYLAMQGMKVFAVDYLADMQARVDHLAQTQQVSVSFVCRDLEAATPPNMPWPEDWHGRFSLLMVARYLHRPQLDNLSTLLAPGGYLLYQTFMQGAEHYGSPKNPNYLLKPDELRLRLRAQCEILEDKVFRLTDGRPVSHFIARKY